jgi:ABC-type transport system involved in multi-copper enzyme maturation permease subunit
VSLLSNPEFRRHVWLELTPHRLVAMPALLALIFLLVAMGASEARGAALAFTALGIFTLLCPLWGARLTVDSVADEFRDKTWDTQRMSALTPWELAAGKLLGASVFAWYGGLICLGVFLLSASGAKFPLPVLTTLGLALGLTLLVHGVALFFTLVSVRRRRETRSSLGLLGLLAVLYVAGPLISLAAQEKGTTIWYGTRFETVDFVLWSAWAFAAWAVTAAWRVLCQELQVRTTPVAWLAFAAFMIFYLAGFVLPSSHAGLVSSFNLLLAVGLLVTLAMSYLAMWWDAKDAVSLRRIQLAWQRRDRTRLLEELPCWLVTLAPALVFALLLIPATPEALKPLVGQGYSGWVGLGLFLYVLRDTLVLYLCCLKPGSRRGESTALLYLSLAYLVVPWLFKSAGLETLANLVLPPVFEDPLAAIALLLIHAGGMAWLLRRRWQAQAR